MKKIKFAFKNLVELKNYFGLLTFVTFALGYIGFYTYAARYSLPFIYPDISLIIGIGIVSILLIIGFYYSSGGKFKRCTTALQSMMLFYILTFVALQLNPIILFLTLYIYMDWDFGRSFSSRGKSFSEKKKVLAKIEKRNKIWHIILIIAFTLIGFFVNYTLTIIWFFIYSGIFVFKRIRFGIVEFHKIFLTIVLTPIFIFGFLFHDFDFTFFGLYQTSVIMTKKDSTNFKGKLIFKDDQLYYFEDSLIQQTRGLVYEINRSRAISRDEIISYKIDTFVRSKRKRKGIFDLIRNPN